MIELLLVAERFLANGELDRAEHLFAQVAEADPRNAIAVAGLARVALAQGDRPQALDLARRALAIDPDEAAAQRLVGEVVLADLEVADLSNQVPAAGGPGAGSSPEVATRRSLWSRILKMIGLRN